MEQADNVTGTEQENAQPSEKHDYHEVNAVNVTEAKTEAVPEAVSETKPYTCPECGKVFDSETSPRFHRLRSHRVPLKRKEKPKPTPEGEAEGAEIPSERDVLRDVLRKFKASKVDAILSLADVYGFSVPAVYAAMRDVGESLATIRGVIQWWSRYKRQRIPDYILADLQPSLAPALPDWEYEFGYGPRRPKSEVSEAGSLLHGVAAIIKAVKPENPNLQAYTAPMPAENPELAVLRQQNEELRKRVEELEKQREEERWNRLEGELKDLKSRLESVNTERAVAITTIKETAQTIRNLASKLEPVFEVMAKESAVTYRILKSYERAKLIEKIQSEGYDIEIVEEKPEKPPENREELPPEKEGGVAQYLPEELVEEG